MEYEDPVVKAKRPQFFELIKDLGEFVVLLKTDPIDFDEKVGREFKRGNATYIDMNDTTTIISQNETIYIMDVDGNGKIMPYLEIRYKNKSIEGFIKTPIPGVQKDLDHKGVKTKFINQGLLPKYVGMHLYVKLEEYAKENKLSFKDKEGLFSILDYYEELLER